MLEVVKHKQKWIQRKHKLKNSMELAHGTERGVVDSLVMMNGCSVTGSWMVS